jgi:hypothetical protein
MFGSFPPPPIFFGWGSLEGQSHDLFVSLFVLVFRIVARFPYGHLGGCL